MQLTLGQAARLAGRGKTTLTRAIQAGKLSAVRRDDGSYQIDVAELSRVYKLRNVTPEMVSQSSLSVHHATRHRIGEQDPETAARLAELETEVRMLRELLAEVKASRDELRAERDDWRSRAERLLTHEQKVVSEPSAPPPTPQAVRPSRPAPKVKSASALALEPETPSHFVSRDEMDTEAGMAAIRARIQARLSGH